MIKLSASVSKKLPLPDVEFSSHCCSAGMEVEIADTLTANEVRERLKKLYAVLDLAVDEQLRHRSPLPEVTMFPGGRSGGNGDGRAATEAQVNAILSMARDRGITGDQLERGLRREYGIRSPEKLSIRQASRVIDRLKNGREATL